jgi:hypothetical protein
MRGRASLLNLAALATQRSWSWEWLTAVGNRGLIYGYCGHRALRVVIANGYAI